jgi:hypothetical protein
MIYISKKSTIFYVFIFNNIFANIRLATCIQSQDTIYLTVPKEQITNVWRLTWKKKIFVQIT